MEVSILDTFQRLQPDAGSGFVVLGSRWSCDCWGLTDLFWTLVPNWFQTFPFKFLDVITSC